MNSDFVDDELAAGLGSKAANALAEWAQMKELSFRHPRWLLNGRSKAVVAVVFQSDLQERRGQRLVLKLSLIDFSLGRAEFARHRDAFRNAGEFALPHLSKVVHDPISVGDGWWIIFQQVAGGSLDDFEVLTVLLDRMLGRPMIPQVKGPAKSVECGAETFASACGQLVRGVLSGWAKLPALPAKSKDYPTVERFLGYHLGTKLEPDGNLHSLAQQHRTEQIFVHGEDRALPNPFALATGKVPASSLIVPAILGRCHGDLHTDNALVRVRPKIDVTDFRLIDIALYEPEGPLTRDPAHLVLYVIARSMDTLSPQQQSSLIDLLLDPRAGPADLVPGWLHQIISQVNLAAEEWLAEHSLIDEWRQQTVLSILGCALLFAGRNSTREQDRTWFLRLAARAAESFVATSRLPLPVGFHTWTTVTPEPAGATSTGQTVPAEATSTWVAHLCRHLPGLVRIARKLNRSPELDELVTAALAGEDRGDSYRSFVADLGGVFDDGRYGLEGSAGRALSNEVYVCPRSKRCGRLERRQPSGPFPACPLEPPSARPMYREFQ